MKSQPKIFTLDEANALIPELTSRLSRVILQREQCLSRHDTLLMEELIASVEQEKDYPDCGTFSVEEDTRLIEEDLAAIRQEIDSLTELGCIVRNLDNGSVDFLGRQGGELVFFCWRQGEEKISYFHGIREDFSDRVKLA